jgi:hypothetical protein
MSPNLDAQNRLAPEEVAQIVAAMYSRWQCHVAIRIPCGCRTFFLSRDTGRSRAWLPAILVTDRVKHGGFRW